MEFVTPESLESPHLRALSRWYAKARQGEAWPPRDAFRPELLPPATLTHIGLVEVEPEPFRVLYRVLGETLTEGFGETSVRMRYLDETDWPQRADLEALWRRAYAEARPTWLRGSQTIGGVAVVYEGCALPVGEPAQPTRRYVIGEDYLNTEAWRQAVARRGYRTGS